MYFKIPHNNNLKRIIIMVKTIIVFVITNSIFILQSLLNNIKKNMQSNIIIAIRYFSKPEIFQL